MKLSLVVVNYRSSDLVARCLEAVDPSWCSHVVIVDNSAEPGEAVRLEQIVLAVPRTLIVEESNLGFGTAANHGIDTAFRENRDSPVWLVNPDTTFPRQTAEALISRLELGLDDVLSPVVVTGELDDRRVWFAGGSADRETGAVVHDDYLSAYDHDAPPFARPTSFMCGAAPVFTPGAWATLGGFRDDLFLYWEDAELSLRAQDAGLRMTVIGRTAPPVWHAVGGTSEGTGQSDAFYFYSARNRLMIMAERTSFFRAIRPAASWQMIKFALRPLRNERSARVHKSFQVLRGSISGLRRSLEPRSKADKA